MSMGFPLSQYTVANRNQYMKQLFLGIEQEISIVRWPWDKRKWILFTTFHLLSDFLPRDIFTILHKVTETKQNSSITAEMTESWSWDNEAVEDRGQIAEVRESSGEGAPEICTWKPLLKKLNVKLDKLWVKLQEAWRERPWGLWTEWRFQRCRRQTSNQDVESLVTALSIHLRLPKRS